jgi:cytochrome c-type biogenesis protein CcmE
MKSKHIVVLVLIAMAIAIILSTYTDASTTVNFRQASEDPAKEFHVKTTLVKEKDIVYDPIIDPELFTFFAKDNEGVVRKVTVKKEKPFDFERAEEVVLIGKVVGDDDFVASDFQTKCPSKYETEVDDIGAL